MVVNKIDTYTLIKSPFLDFAYSLIFSEEPRFSSVSVVLHEKLGKERSKKNHVSE
jgi:hypothetical protein